MTERSYPRMGMTPIMLNMPRKVVQLYSTPMMFCTFPTLAPASISKANGVTVVQALTSDSLGNMGRQAGNFVRNQCCRHLAPEPICLKQKIVGQCDALCLMLQARLHAGFDQVWCLCQQADGGCCTHCEHMAYVPSSSARQRNVCNPIKQ